MASCLIQNAFVILISNLHLILAPNTPSSLIFIFCFVLVMTSAGVTMIAAIYKENRRTCLVALLLLVVLISMFLLGSVASFSNDESLTDWMCVEGRCPETLWQAPLKKKSKRKHIEFEKSRTTYYNYYDTKETPAFPATSLNWTEYETTEDHNWSGHHRRSSHGVFTRPTRQEIKTRNGLFTTEEPEDIDEEEEEEEEEEVEEDDEFVVVTVVGVVLFVIYLMFFVYCSLLIFSYSQELNGNFKIQNDKVSEFFR